MNTVFHTEVPIQLSCGINCVPRKFSGSIQLPDSSIINIADLKRNLIFAKDSVFQGAKTQSLIISLPEISEDGTTLVFFSF